MNKKRLMGLVGGLCLLLGDRSEAAVSTAKPGNLFTTGEKVVLQCDLPEGAWTYRITDGWGQEAGRGALRIGGKGGELAPDVSKPGWYELELRKTGAADVAHSRFAIFEPYDLSKVPESAFGVMTHFAAAWDPDLIPVLAAAGVKNIRDEIFWASIEKVKGEYVFPEKFEVYMKALADHFMEPLTPLTFGNTIYDHVEGGPSYGIAPYTKEGIEGYVAYAEAVLKHYGKQIKAVEVWNEFNGAFGRGPADGKAKAYAEILNPTYDAVKKLRPDVEVLGCSTIGIPIPWIDEVLKAGGATHMDAVSVHPYGYLFAPESHIDKLQALHELFRKYGVQDKMGIWATEQGYYTTEPGQHGNREQITEEVQARYLTRVYTLFLAYGVEKTFWYLGRDDDAFGTMGLVGKPDSSHGKYAPKRALVAYGTLIRELTGTVYKGEDVTPEGVLSYHFQGPKGPVRVLWGTSPREVALRSDTPLQVADLYGGRTEVHPIDGQVHLHASEAPVFVAGAVASIEEGKAFSIQMPAETAEGESLRLSVAAPDGVVVNTPAKAFPGKSDVSGRAGERWFPVKARKDGNVVYAGALKTKVLPALWVDPFPRLLSDDILEIHFRNISETKSFTLSEVALQLGDQKVAEFPKLTVAPRSEEKVRIKVGKVPSFTLTPAEALLTFTDGTKAVAKGTVSYNPAPHKTMIVDGEVTDWDGIEGLDLKQAKFKELLAKHEGGDDLSGNVYLAWDDDALYLLARVIDNAFHQEHSGYSTWKGDNLQLGIAADLPWTGGEWKQGWLELGVSLTQDGTEFFRAGGPGASGVLKDVPLVIKRIGNETRYEMAIPWKELAPAKPENGAIGFGIFVNDNDGKGRRGYLEWSSIKELDKMQPVLLKK